MAYTTPPTFNVGDVLTAAQMNAYVRDNVAYLKGSAGTVAIDSGMTVAGTLTTTDTFQVNKATPDSQAYLSSSGPRIALGNNAIYGSRTLSARWVLATANGQFGLSTAGDSWLFTEGIGGGTAGRLIFGANSSSNQLVLGTTGNVGIGTGTPQGALHVLGAGAVAGAGHVVGSVAAVTSIQTVFAAGTVARSALFLIIDRDNTGPTLGGPALTGCALGSSFTYLNTDTITIAVTAGGAITAQRTSGTHGTHDITMFVILN